MPVPLSDTWIVTGFTVPASAVGTRTVPHESAVLHACGAAAYTDDLPEPRGTLFAALGVSTGILGGTVPWYLVRRWPSRGGRHKPSETGTR